MTNKQIQEYLKELELHTSILREVRRNLHDIKVDQVRKDYSPRWTPQGDS